VSRATRKHWRNENGIDNMSACGRHLQPENFVIANPEAVTCERCKASRTHCNLMYGLRIAARA
jgi:hypothetical protein